jgi:excisionase family DNA binding protein
MTARLRSVGEAAHELGVSKDHVRRLISRGVMRSVRLGLRVLIPQLEIDRLVAGLPLAAQSSVGKERSSKKSVSSQSGGSASRVSKRS